MSRASQLQLVLDRIDADLDNSLDRLFALLRIQSISTDPAYAPHCRTAAEYVAADLRSLGHTICARPIYPLDEGVAFTPAPVLYQRR